MSGTDVGWQERLGGTLKIEKAQQVLGSISTTVSVQLPPYNCPSTTAAVLLDQYNFLGAAAPYNCLSTNASVQVEPYHCPVQLRAYSCLRTTYARTVSTTGSMTLAALVLILPYDSA